MDTKIVASLLCLKYLRIEHFRAGIVKVVLDDPEKSANVLTAGLHEDLRIGLDYLQSRTDLRGVILASAKAKIFVAGADLVNIARTLDWPDEKIIEFCHHGRRLYNRFRENSWVSVAAIQGACVGGGWELALGCDYQVCADDPRTFLGLPEVRLGLIPGWAGTVRVPRLAGLDLGLDLVTSGRNLPVSEARARGLAHALASPDQLLERAAEIIEEIHPSGAHLAKRKSDIQPIADDFDRREQLLAEWKRRIEQNKEIHPFAPMQAAEHMIHTANLPFEEACLSEAKAMSRVYGSPASYGLLNNFFLNEHNRKRPGFAQATSAARGIKVIGIAGLGLMGQAIVNACLKHCDRIVGFDISSSARAAAGEAIQDPKFIVTDQLRAMQSCELVIETIVEQPSEKRKLFSELAGFVSDTAILATNTSTIQIETLRDVVPDDRRFCGIHFCHPTLMNLVEIVRTANTSEETLSEVIHWARKLGKTPVVVRDAPGFVVNRLLAALLDAAIQLAIEGNSISEIDQALRSAGFLGGPFEMMDLIGLDTTVLAGQSLLEAKVPQVSRNPALLKLIQAGRLGRKSLAGFYKYSRFDAAAELDDFGLKIFNPYLQKSSTNYLNANEMADRMLAAMFLAASDVLEAGIAADPRDVDLCSILGLSLPASIGGILFWAQRTDINRLKPAVQWVLSHHPNAGQTRAVADCLAGRAIYQTV